MFWVVSTRKWLTWQADSLYSMHSLAFAHESYLAGEAELKPYVTFSKRNIKVERVELIG